MKVNRESGLGCWLAVISCGQVSRLVELWKHKLSVPVDCNRFVKAVCFLPGTLCKPHLSLF